ncbi:MAG TPA: glycosyltransferase [Nitrospiraceae bacterium]|nr:glycosyltransferase [Nitrospiraceae bacterium]
MVVSDSRITVVVLTYTRVREVSQTVECLLGLPEHPTIIVVDNGSTDGTSDVLARRFPSIRIITLERNVGAAARNVGIRAARTPYVALCDDDTWWAAGSLRRAADVFDDHPHVAVLTARVLVGPEGREDPTCRRMEQSPLAAESDLPGIPILGFLAGASMIRRTAFLSVGGFEPRFFLGGEEALVAVDLAAAGWQMVYMRDVIVRHYPSHQRDARARRRLLLRNALWFTWLRRPFPTAVQQTGRLLRPALADPHEAWGFFQAVAGLPWIMRRRRCLPAAVEAALLKLGDS